MARIEPNIYIIPVPKFFITFMEKIGAERTILNDGEQVLAHMHKHISVYFTSNVKWIDGKNGRKRLPAHAIAIVLPRAVHGWVDTAIKDKIGVVSHFHHGHPVHHIGQA